MNNFFKQLAQDSKSGFFLVAGPCVIENDTLTLDIAGELKQITRQLGIPLIFKASFDKANRTSIHSFRGPGFHQGLDILRQVKEKYDVPVISDIHLPEQAHEAAKTLDVLQIPAFLCRQTDLITAACRTGRPVNIKKGQFLSPSDCANILTKVRESGGKDYCITERGASFGYNNLVVDFRSIPIIQALDSPVIFDATHSVQLPGGGTNASAGDRQFVPTLSKAAVAAGVDGLFLETHPEPDTALCDGPNSIELAKMKDLLQILKAIRLAAG